MAQLKRYNGTSWENVGGSVAPKTSQTTSDTDTYSCNYVNNNLTNIKSAIDYKSPDYMGDVVVESIRSKNLFNPYIQSGTYSSGVTYTVASDGKITQSASDGALWPDTTAKSFTLPAGTYTFSIIGKGSSNTFQVYNYNTSSNIHESAVSTFTYTFNETTRLGIKTYGSGSSYPQSYYIQIEKGTTATSYSQFQELDGTNYIATEEVIGTWIDGKPLYRSVINGGTITTSNISIGNISNIDTLVNIKGTAYSSNFDQYYGMPNVHSNIGEYYINVFMSGNGVVIRYGTGFSNGLSKVIAILEYTKTTD